MRISNYLLLTGVLLLFFSTVPGEAYFKCYECDSRISSDDCDANKVEKICNASVVYMDGEEWWPTFDRCLKIVDETKDPPWYYRRCGFYDIFLYYIREICYKPLCSIDYCEQPLCLIGNNEYKDQLYTGS
ncbi:hypothetical protein OS493_034530 [Desmophyllum pertusum]|uniref:Protein quiver n=1 Tax=Desmophyllum pertusum TaxID=174260 RepID=A0A9W9YIM7_9CNID|nr:hypothetical protein OS493_034530 [Desmophyllum pertusum]